MPCYFAARSMALPPKLVVSTRNPDKLRELRALLSDVTIELVSASMMNVPEVDETGETLAENARLKAVAGWRSTGLPSLGDDTGLCVDALGGAPGVRSARFAGLNATYADNRELLLTRLAEVPETARAATFVTALVFIVPAAMVPELPGAEAVVVERLHAQQRGEAWLATVHGQVRGRILTAPRGAGAFGYDPVFWVPSLDKTYAELTPREKNAISHRGLAYRALHDLLLLAFPSSVAS